MPPGAQVPLSMLVVFASAKLLCEIFERLGQPGIVGEILAGVLIGAACPRLDGAQRGTRDPVGPGCDLSPVQYRAGGPRLGITARRWHGGCRSRPRSHSLLARRMGR